MAASCPIQIEANKPDGHKRPQAPKGAELHKHSAEARGFDGPARLGTTGDKE